MVLSRLLSVQVSDCDVKSRPIGPWLVAKATVCGSTYRDALTRTAVLPFPKTSYASPTRGDRSFQFGVPPKPAYVVVAVDEIAPSHGLGRTASSPTLPMNQSRRNPAVMVAR